MTHFSETVLYIDKTNVTTMLDYCQENLFVHDYILHWLINMIKQD